SRICSAEWYSHLRPAIARRQGAATIVLGTTSVQAVPHAVNRCSQPDTLTGGRHIPVECSGGIRLDNVRAYAETGVDFISVGLLTHSTHAADMSMRVLPA